MIVRDLDVFGVATDEVVLQLADEVHTLSVFWALEVPERGLPSADAPNHGRCMRPNVRVKRAPTVWHLARAVDDKQHYRAGQVPRRWGSA